QTLDCIQSFQHKYKKHYGIQYHPESFATEYTSSSTSIS
ncbi:hypothetical protein ACQKHK_07050, partial [Staphylococcus capitis]